MVAKKETENDVWINRKEIKSESSNRVYIVAQHKGLRHWACNCPGFKAHRKCKHLMTLSLPCHMKPYELPNVEKEVAKKKLGFVDGYKTYDTSKGLGSPEQWRKEFIEQMGLEEAEEYLNKHHVHDLATPNDKNWSAMQKMVGQTVAAVMEVAINNYRREVGHLIEDLRTGSLPSAVYSSEKLKEMKFKAELLSTYLQKQHNRMAKEIEDLGKEVVAKVKGK